MKNKVRRIFGSVLMVGVIGLGYAFYPGFTGSTVSAQIRSGKATTVKGLPACDCTDVTINECGCNG
jgi:hypothetical protein